MKPLTSVEGRRALEVVVCLEDSILDVIHVRGPGQVRAGHDAGCQVSLPAEALGGQGGIVLASMDASGQAYAAVALDDRGELRPIGPTDNVSLESGRVRIFVRTVPEAPSPGRPSGWGIDARTWRVVGASLAGHLLFVALLVAIPPEARALSTMDLYREGRLIKLQAKPTEDPKLVPPPPGANGATGAAADPAQATAASPEAAGKMGRPDTKTTGSTQMKGEQAQDRPGDVSARDWVSSKGILGVLRTTDMSALIGSDEQWGSKDRWTYGSDVGVPGDGPGTIGMAYVAKQTGGCPTGARSCTDGSIGTGKYDTIGVSPGDTKWTTGPGVRVGPRGHAPGVPPRIGQPTIGPDGLDKAIIKRYIRERIEAIGYCYERELNVNHGLGGTITVEFVIGPNGSVISARGNGTVGSGGVDGCVVDQVRGIQFPKNDGLTTVKYPFTFRAAGQP